MKVFNYMRDNNLGIVPSRDEWLSEQKDQKSSVVFAWKSFECDNPR